MNGSKVLKANLLVSGVILLAVGSILLLAPAAMHGANGVDLGSNPSLLSEVRAPGGSLLALGGLVLASVFVSRLRYPATMIAATVYIAYGLSRLLSMAIDGMPAPGIVAAAGLEIMIGTVNVVMLTRLRLIA
jgi:hypothetical protein|nr:DUF4345 domain-containing protein [Candidatus Krumholzibacteria bacterium]